MNNKSFWNRYASVYDKIIGNKINNNEMFNFILKYTGKDDRLIEAACGTGAFTCLLSPNLGEIIILMWRWLPMCCTYWINLKQL